MIKVLKGTNVGIRNNNPPQFLNFENTGKRQSKANGRMLSYDIIEATNMVCFDTLYVNGKLYGVYPGGDGKLVANAIESEFAG